MPITRTNNDTNTMDMVAPFLFLLHRLPFIATLLLIPISRTSCQHTPPSPPISRISFGSCANQSAPQKYITSFPYMCDERICRQPIWEAILKFEPQLFIWLGDNIYGDIRRPYKLFGTERNIGPWKNSPRFVPSSEQEMQSKYDKAKANPGYSRLLSKAMVGVAVGVVMGTWDDHDYGLNDAGKEFDRKITNQRLLLDFLDEPKDSPRRNQAGVYTAYTVGPVGKQVKIILLDTRYHRDPLFSNGTILGSSQWTWLQKELNGPVTAITIIASSIQVISNLSAMTGPMFYMESWGRFPRERDRLFKLIKDSKRDGVFFISGDVHFGEITRYDCATGYPLYDITSSGLTQAIEKVVPPPLHLIVRIAAWLIPTTMRVISPNCRYRYCSYGQPNFGTIEIDWDSNPVGLKIEVRDIHGFPVTSINTLLSELQSNGVVRNVGEHNKQCFLEVDMPWIVRYRLLIILCCLLTALLLAFVALACAIVSIGKRCLKKCKCE